MNNPLTVTANWWKSLSRTVRVISYVGITSGAIYSTSQAWPIVEPYWYAHRAMLRAAQAQSQAKQETVNSEIRDLTITAQLDINDERRERLLHDAQKWELELQSDQAKTTPQYHELVQDRLDTIKKTLKRIDNSDELLSNKRSKGSD